MKKLAECAPEILMCEIYDKQSSMLHLMIASYVADIPEIEGLLSVEPRNQTFMLCHWCKTNRKDLASFTTAQRRYKSRTKAALEKTKSLS